MYLPKHFLKEIKDLTPLLQICYKTTGVRYLVIVMMTMMMMIMVRMMIMMIVLFVGALIPEPLRLYTGL